MRTYFPSAKEPDKRGWRLIDADGQVLGRLASQIAAILRGKDKPDYTPGVDNGDFVIVINAEKVRVTGRKEKQKIYYRHSGYPGGLKETSLAQMRAKHPERIIELAVRGMLPKTAQGRRLLRKLKVYAGPEHPHQAQCPQEVELG